MGFSWSSQKWSFMELKKMKNREKREGEETSVDVFLLCFVMEGKRLELFFSFFYLEIKEKKLLKRRKKFPFFFSSNLVVLYNYILSIVFTHSYTKYKYLFLFT